MRQPRKELLEIVLAIGAVPWGPPLALSALSAPWEAVAAGVVWAVCWYVWVAYAIAKGGNEHADHHP